MFPHYRYNSIYSFAKTWGLVSCHFCPSGLLASVLHVFCFERTVSWYTVPLVCDALICTGTVSTVVLYSRLNYSTTMKSLREPVSDTVL